MKLSMRSGQVLSLLLLLISPSPLWSKRVNAQHGLADEAVAVESAPQKDNQRANKDNQRADTCSNLGKAYLASLPIPAPPPGLSIVPAVALVICCPTQVWGKLKSVWADGKEKVQDWQKTEAQRFVDSAMPTLSDDELEAAAEDMKRKHIMELYNTLVEEQITRPKDQIGVHSDDRFNSENYASNMQAKTDIEKTYPWVLYPRLNAAYKDKRLTEEEKYALTEVMRQLETDNAWLLPEQPSGNSTANEDIAAIQPTNETTIEEEEVMRKFSTYALDKRNAMCGYIGHLAKQAVTWGGSLMDKPSELQLRDLVARVEVFLKDKKI